MCGIAGFFTVEPRFSRQDLQKITDVLAHRGPDASGFYFDDTIGLGHRRLSIIDLSENANQPMVSADGNYVIIYNGEIYNHKEIAEELGIELKTTCDTEVILEGFAKWGDKIVSKLNGMFAFAIYDKAKSEMFLARDRMGIKPLFYFWNGSDFIFGSEIKSLLQLDFIQNRKQINKKALNDYLYLGYIPEPHTIYEGINKFPSGAFLKIAGKQFESTKYWKLEEKIHRHAVDSEAEAKKKLSELMISSVRYRLMSDVPFGTFLSGGTDSSLVTAVAQKLNSEPVNTFSIGFKEASFNESEYARAVAKYLGTRHHEFVVSYSDAIELFDHILEVYDEPFADSSVVPTLLVSKLARQHVKMTLSGDGGDETYMGYGFYKWAKRLNNPLVKLFRNQAAMALSWMPSRFERVSHLLKYSNATRIKSHIFSQEQYDFTEVEIADFIHPDYYEAIDIDEKLEIPGRKLNSSEEQALFDLKYYLRDELLVKVDRASMHHSLETRVPLLDHRLVEFALNINENLRLRGTTLKYLLKQLLYDYVPQKYFNRPKWGFGMPLSIWLKNELKHLVEEYLSEEMTKKIGLLQPSKVSSMVRNYYEGKDYLYQRIWICVILHKWYDKNFMS